jgi:hypothetical protein
MPKPQDKKLSKEKLNKSILWLLEPQNRTDKKPWEEDSDNKKEAPLKIQPPR